MCRFWQCAQSIYRLPYSGQHATILTAYYHRVHMTSNRAHARTCTRTHAQLTQSSLSLLRSCIANQRDCRKLRPIAGRPAPQFGAKDDAFAIDVGVVGRDGPADLLGLAQPHAAPAASSPGVAPSFARSSNFARRSAAALARAERPTASLCRCRNRRGSVSGRERSDAVHPGPKHGSVKSQRENPLCFSQCAEH